jgi:hypothetical protein
MELIINNENNIDIKWRRRYEDGNETPWSVEVAYMGEKLYHRDINLDAPTEQQLEWKESDIESAKLILGFQPSKTLLSALKEDLYERENLDELEFY